MYIYLFLHIYLYIMYIYIYSAKEEERGKCGQIVRYGHLKGPVLPQGQPSSRLGCNKRALL